MQARHRLRRVTHHLHPRQRPNLTTESCCGIIGVIGSTDAHPFLLEGLRILESRGYDSAGMTTLNDQGQLTTTKFASRGSTHDAIQQLSQRAQDHATHHLGIAHTRWATHGGRTDANAHPHLDQHQRIAVVHNGVIENAARLRAQLTAHGVPFRSQTDSEVIAQLIGWYVHQGQSSEAAIRQTLSQIQGTWGLAIVDARHPDQIWAASNGSPLCIGIDEAGQRMFVASEPAAFGRHTKQFMALENGELIRLTRDGSTLTRSRLTQAPEEKLDLTPEPFPHWTLREIMEQPAALNRVLNLGGRILGLRQVKLGGLDENRQLLVSVRHLLVAACGTSLFAAMAGARWLRAWGGFATVRCVDAAEVEPWDWTGEPCGLLVLSQSGETKDVHRLVVAAQAADIPVFSVVNAVGSLIARTTKLGVYLNAGREHAVASTKAFTCQVACLALLAVWFAQQRQRFPSQRYELIHSLQTLSPKAERLLQNIREPCQRLAASLADTTSMFVLGKGAGLAIAMEAALKIKEMSYIHCEGYGGSSLKHGPYSLVQVGTPVVLVILNDAHVVFMLGVACQLQSRGARVIVVTNCTERQLREGGVQPSTILSVPSNGITTNILTVLPLQVLAYELALVRGINPDRPRNLAKAVTVD